MTLLDVLARAEEMGLDLEAQSDRALVIFYSCTLRAGRWSLLGDGARLRLRRAGLVEDGRGRGGRKTTLTEKAKMILEEEMKK